MISMVVGKVKDLEGISDLLPDFETNKYLLVEVAVLNVLVNLKYNKKGNRNNYDCSTIKDLTKKLRAKSEKYIYRVVNKLEAKGYIENLTPRKREKLIVITKEGEAVLTTIIKFLFPGIEQQQIVLKMFFDSQYIPE